MCVLRGRTLKQKYVLECGCGIFFALHFTSISSVFYLPFYPAELLFVGAQGSQPLGITVGYNLTDLGF